MRPSFIGESSKNSETPFTKSERAQALSFILTPLLNSYDPIFEQIGKQEQHIPVSRGRAPSTPEARQKSASLRLRFGPARRKTALPGSAGRPLRLGLKRQAGQASAWFGCGRFPARLHGEPPPR